MALSEPPIDLGVTRPDDAEPDAPLREYLRAKEAVAHCLRQMQALVEQAAPWAGERVHDLMARLGEDRFQLVVVGQFKRGKSSLMNAIIGRQLLPTGTIPVTSAITSLRYGSTLRATIKRAGQAIDQQIPVSTLPDFITERGNPDNHKRVLSADIEVPARFLRRGLHFIDTPGIGSAHEHNTATTLRFLPEADAAIFVTAADGPLSDVELQFLDAVRQHVRKLFFVLNKIDQLGSQDREEILTYTAGLLSKRLGTATVRLFPFSAVGALATDRSDVRAMETTGLPAVETALATFLNDERRTVFLVALLDRAIGLLEHVRFMIEIRNRALEHASHSDDAARVELMTRLEESERHRCAAIQRLEQRATHWVRTELEPALERFAADAHATLSAKLPSLVDNEAAISREYESYAEESIRVDLQERAEKWLRDTATTVDDFAAVLADEARAVLPSIIDKVDDAAASVFQLNVDGQRTSRVEPDSHPGWPAPAFESHAAHLNLRDAATETLRLLPHFVAVPLTVKRLSKRLPHYIERTMAYLHGVAQSHLSAYVAEIDRTSADRLVSERRRLESVVTAAASTPTSGAAPVPGDAFEALRQILANTTALRDALLEGDRVPESRLADAPPLESRSAAEQTSNTPQEPSARRGVTGTCAICAKVSDAVFDFLCQYQYTIGREGASRDELLASNGLCATHTWHLERLSSPRGLCLGYPPLLDNMEERIKAMANLPAAAATARLREIATHAGLCPACVTRERVEQRAAERLIEILRTADGRARFEQAQWLCLPHLTMVLTDLDDQQVSSMLLRRHARVLGEVSESMREFVIKHDARRRSLMTQEQERSYRQALVMLVGERYLSRTEPDE